MVILDLIYSILAVGFVFLCLWLIYNLPIAAAGVIHFNKSLRKAGLSRKREDDSLPVFSIVVPAKNEAEVIGRLLDALSKVNYPKNKMQVIVVEDGSTDHTVSVCKEHARKGQLDLQVVQKSLSNGKPSALNFALPYVIGDIVGFFDADSVPSSDILLAACKYFENSGVAAVQGRTHTINSDANMLTKLLSYEETVWFEAYLRGRDVLDLFVHLRGSCQFVRREVLEELNGFDESVLSEDMEISARITQKNYKIRYAPEVVAWQESPASLKQLLVQRVRWFRGCIELGFKYGSLLRKPNLRSFDAEATFFAPFVLIGSLATYLGAFNAFFFPLSLSSWLQNLASISAFMITITFVLCSLVLICASKPRKLTNLLWMPFLYFYWSLQAIIALYSVLLILFRAPRKWSKTEKTGKVANSKFFVKD